MAIESVVVVVEGRKMRRLLMKMSVTGNSRERERASEREREREREREEEEPATNRGRGCLANLLGKTCLCCRQVLHSIGSSIKLASG